MNLYRQKQTEKKRIKENRKERKYIECESESE